MSAPFISVSELAALLNSVNPADPVALVAPVVLDASCVLHPAKFDGDYRRDSGRALWLEAHIPTSQHVDVPSQFSDTSAALHYTHPTAQAIADELARIGAGKTDAVVIYDTTGGLFAARLWYLLRWIGVDVRVLDGGLAAWSAAGQPTVSGENPVPISSAPWTVSTVLDSWITKDELVDRSESDARPLVCGLPAGSFTGSDPSRYARRGRIPGSVNVSSRDLFDADGTVKNDGALREAYAAEGVTGAEEVLLYCGGGISASASALTLVELGITAVRIYDGSLEEWSADESLPLALG